MSESAQRAEADPGGAQSTAADLSGLFRGCRWVNEEEQLHELRVPLASGLPPYVELPVERETLFSAAAVNLPLPADNVGVENFLTTFGASLLCYGYPYLRYADGSVRPLFVVRVRIEDGSIRPDPDGYLKVNCALLRDHGIDRHEATRLAQELAADGTGFDDALAVLAERLKLAVERFDPSALDDALPPAETGRMQWCNRPILASATMPPSISALLRDLNDLAHPDCHEGLDQTALAAIQRRQANGDGDQPTALLDGPMVFDMHRLGESQTQAVRAAMRQPLTGVSAPPGTGQMASIVNLIATAVMNGESVLYAGRRRETVGAMVKHLGAAGLSPKADAILLPLVAAADLLILAGYDPIEMRQGWRDPWGPDAPVVEFTAVPNTHYMHQARYSFVGDTGAGLRALRAGLSPRPHWPDNRPARTRAALAEAFPVDQAWGPAAVIETCRRVLPADVVATVDTGAHRILLNQIWRCPAPRTLLQSTALCTMGCALPLAIGRALAEPGRPVVAFTGDGGLEMVLGELATLRDLRLPVIVVVFDDSSLALIEMKQRNLGLANVGVDLGTSDFAAVARAMGGEGVTAGDRDALAGALDQALRRDGFTVIACPIDRRGYDDRF